MLLRICLLLLLLGSLCTAYSQPVIPRFETIGVNEGLSQSSVYAIHQDKFGFMWFGTGDGLNRFDGREIKLFKTKGDFASSGNSNLIRGNLCEDDKGNIWFSSETGIYYYDRLKEQVNVAWSFPKQDNGILYYYLISIDDKQNLWLFSPGLGFVYWKTKTHTLNHYPYPFKITNFRMSASPVTTDAAGNIWFNLYRNGGLYRFNVRTKQLDHFFKNKDFWGIFFGQRKAYLFSETHVYRYDSLTTRWDSMHMASVSQTPYYIRNVFEDRFERLWVPSMTSGLFCYDFDRKKTHQYQHDNARQKSLPVDYMTVLCADRSENLWIGTDGGGVAKLDLKPSRFGLFPLNEGDYPFLNDYFIKCLYEDDQGRVWFGTNSNGLNIYNPADGSVKNYAPQPGKSNGLPAGLVSTIFKDHEGHIWIGHSMGISLFDEKENAFTPLPLRFQHFLYSGQPFVFRIIQLRNGELVAATNHGPVRIKKDEKGRFYGITEYNRSRYSPSCVDVAETKDGDVWLLAPLSGLYRCALANGKDTFSFKERYFPGIDFRSLHVDETNADILWIASGKGLIKFDSRTKRFELLDENNGMANSFLYGILEDARHNFWISSNGGLIYFDRANRTFQNFAVNNGLQSNEFNTGAFHKGQSGTFYFGGVKGFNWFTAKRPALEKAYHPQVALTGIYINDHPFQKDTGFDRTKTIVLSHNKNNLSFSFAALDFTRPQANKIHYKLEGWDPHWFTTQDKMVRYPNLPAGRYVLKIKATNADGIDSAEQQLTLTIEAPFWRRWWFFVIIGIVLLVSAIIITQAVAQKKLRQQLREMEKQRAVEAERNRISKDMHDEIGSGLTHIALMSELIQGQQKAGEELRKDVGTISHSARKLVQSMSEIIWALNPQNDTLENLLAYLREQMAAYFEPFDLDFIIDFPDDVPPLKLTNEQRRNLFMVAKEALNNALKHAGARTIKLQMKLQKEKISFCVADDGCGFDLLKVKVFSNGLRNMQRRMEAIGGFIEVSSDRSGTEVHFGLSLSNLRKKWPTTFFTFTQQSGKTIFETDDFHSDYRR